ncbi:MAG: helix-turn-helix transcriptional regulator [Verrucomicrobia bacterium]|nr:helix-turn-helix transcriptional regulator [Verrucomicrobiota bacterium]
MRQLLVRENDPPPGVSVATHSREYPRGSHIPEHAHGSNQLIYASRGVMEVTSGKNWWKIPPHFGLWIPARTPHHIRMPEHVSMRTLYLRTGLAQRSPSCTVLHVCPLLRELIVEIVRRRQLRFRHRVECALRDLLVAELERASPVPTGVVFPTDPRAIRVAQTIIAEPGSALSLKSICAAAGVSVRTLERVFRNEVGTDIECWRRQIRLMNGAELLVSGLRVKEVAFAVGYQHPSAFVSLFRATFGTTPRAWVSALEQLRITMPTA